MAFIDDIQAQTQKAEKANEVKATEEFNEMLRRVKDAIKSASERGLHETSFSIDLNYGRFIVDHIDDFRDALPGFTFGIQPGIPAIQSLKTPKIVIISW